MRTPQSKMFRAIVMGGASLVGTATLAVICDACGSGETAGPICPQGALFAAPCGIKSVTTTCTGQVSCEPTPNTGCSVGPIEADCEIDVVLGDGTAHTIAVTVGEKPGCGSIKVVTAQQPQNFSSTTCKPPPPTFDASPDAIDDAPDTADAVEDASGDAASDVD